MPLSVTIATENESEKIIQCMTAVSSADEIVIVDDCSSRDTVEKAKRAGPRALVRESGGSFHENKNLALDEAKYSGPPFSSRSSPLYHIVPFLGSTIGLLKIEE